MLKMGGALKTTIPFENFSFIKDLILPVVIMAFYFTVLRSHMCAHIQWKIEIGNK